MSVSSEYLWGKNVNYCLIKPLQRKEEEEQII